MRQIIIRPLVAAAIVSGFVLGGMATAAPTAATDDVNLTSTPLALVANEDDDNDDNDGILSILGILSSGSESDDDDDNGNNNNNNDDDDDDDDNDDDGILGILFL